MKISTHIILSKASEFVNRGKEVLLTFLGRGGIIVKTRERVAEVYRFGTDAWCEDNTVGFNPYRTRSFVNSEGLRVVIPPCPIKIWQGDADTVVDPVMIKEFADSVRRGGCYIELRSLRGVGHVTTDTMREELCLWFLRFV